MKKVGILLLAALLLAGCMAAPVYEDLSGMDVHGEVPAVKRISIDLPEDAAMQTVQGGSGKIYFCDGYEIMVETLPSGDLDRSLRSLTGFSRDALAMVETKTDGHSRYSCVWTSIGETGEQVGRVDILDDGAYHYCVCVTAPAKDAYELQQEFQVIFDSFALEAS